ncbi:MAG: tRNA dihydrouridine(20/20a) synthase DusA [Leptospira sp.]|nr:tRNA dihydrouridine(20/20a) synthase DusA [Leptospira sp.]
MKETLLFPISIAPMMEWTDRHYRFLMRLFTKNTILYTEMVTADAIIRGNRDKLLGKNRDNPVVLQLGGNDPQKIFQASKISLDYGYDALNLNVGCPSDRVSDGSFGACLMNDPNRVVDLMIAMREGGNIPVSVKHRIGINGKETYEDLCHFVETISVKANVSHFIVHARIAILGGLSPAENRSIPPLRYEDVYRLKEEFPHLRIEINGGIRDLQQAKEFLTSGIDAVMIGRAAYENPLLFANADDMFHEKDSSENIDWNVISDSIEKYLSDHIANDGKVHHVLRHCMGFFHGVNGGKKFRRFLSETMNREPKNSKLFTQALQFIQQ